VMRTSNPGHAAPPAPAVYPVRRPDGQMVDRATEAEAQLLIQSGLASWRRGHGGLHLRLGFGAPCTELLRVSTDASRELIVRHPGTFLDQPARQDAKPIYRHKRSRF
jgi:hypothetical protein